jgi:hypothetical protein
MKRWIRQHGGRLPKAALSSAVCAVLVMAGTSARADGASGIRAHLPRFSDHGSIPVRRWYGYQTMLADVASTSLFVAGAASLELCVSVFGPPNRTCHNEVPSLLIGGGAAGYLFASPILHAAHGNWDKAGYSFGMRAAPVAAAIGLGVAGDATDVAPVVLGASAVSAMILDSALLGYETVPREGPTVSLAPSYDVMRGIGSLVVAGEF